MVHSLAEYLAVSRAAQKDGTSVVCLVARWAWSMDVLMVAMKVGCLVARWAWLMDVLMVAMKVGYLVAPMVVV